MDTEITIEGLDLVDVVDFVTRKKNKFAAICLSELEEVMDKDSKEFKIMRKIVLDTLNDYTRSIMRILFGDIEGLIMK